MPGIDRCGRRFYRKPRLTVGCTAAAADDGKIIPIMSVTDKPVYTSSTFQN
jgi:hypothetical protein